MNCSFSQALYSMGLRKFLLAGVGPLGCIPSQRASGLAPADRCVDQVNQMVGFFNRGVRSLVQQLNTNHPGAIFVYGNTYGAVGDILNNPATYGLPTTQILSLTSTKRQPINRLLQYCIQFILLTY